MADTLISSSTQGANTRGLKAMEDGRNRVINMDKWTNAKTRFSPVHLPRIKSVSATSIRNCD